MIMSRKYTQEQLDFIVESIVDKEMTYLEILPIFNKKFNENKTLGNLQNLGWRLGIKVIKHKVLNFNYEKSNPRNVSINYHFKNQAPIGTIITRKRNGEIRQLIKIKMIPKELYGSGKDFRADTRFWYSYPKWIYEHHYNVKLKPNEYIFHIDGNYLNNEISNLICLKTSAIGFMGKKGFLDSTTDIRRIGFKLCKLNEITKEEIK